MVENVQRGTVFITCTGRFVGVCSSSHLAHLYLHTAHLFSVPFPLFKDNGGMSIYKRLVKVQTKGSII